VSIGILSNAHILLSLYCLLNTIWISVLSSGTTILSWMILGGSRIVNEV
jgi:hypothetical protein